MEAGAKEGGLLGWRGEYSRETAAQRRLRRGVKQEMKRKRECHVKYGLMRSCF